MSLALGSGWKMERDFSFFLHFFFLLVITEGEGNPCESWSPHAVYAGDGICFRLNQKSQSFSHARDLCESEHNVHLAEVRSDYQRQTVIDLISTNAVTTWLGASDQAQEGVWRWLTNNDLINIPSLWWNPGEPDGGVGIDGLVMDNGLLYDRSLTAQYFSTCQKYGGNPCEGFFPQSEFYDGSCFMAVTENLTLDAAQERCEQVGGFLAEPNTEGLISFLSLFAGMHFSQTASIVLGLAKDPDDKFRWISTGLDITDSNWLQLTLTSIETSISNGGTASASASSSWQPRQAVFMEGRSSWQWVTADDKGQGQAVCQKVIPVFSHSYLAAVADSTLSVTDSAFFTASHTHSKPGWITVEVTSNPGAFVENIYFLGQEGMHFSLNTDTQRRSFLVRSTEPLHVTLTLWSMDLSAISSSLLLPVVDSDLPVSRLAQPADTGQVSLGIVTTLDSLRLDVAFDGGKLNSGFSMEEFHYNICPWVIMSTNLTGQLQPLFIDHVTGYGQALFVMADQAAVEVSSSSQPYPASTDVTFEQVLSTSQVGSDYVTFPSLPLNDDTKDRFTVVAVYDNTVVKVPNADKDLDPYDVTLVKAGDNLDVSLYANGFRHVTASKPFYLYARPRGTGESSCSVTLVADHLWTDQYTVHMAEPWTQLEAVYVIAVGQGDTMATVSLTSLDGASTIWPTECLAVQGTNYTGCYFTLESTEMTYGLTSTTNHVFTAYMWGTHGQAGACHQLGVDTNTSAGPEHLFDGQAYLESVRVEVQEVTTVSEVTTQQTTPEGTTEQTTAEGPTTVVPELTTAAELYTTDKDSPTTAATSEASTNGMTSTTVGIPDNVTGELPICGYQSNVTLTPEQFQEMMESIAAYIRVDSQMTSQTRRKKETAQDNRVSSVSMGVFSCSLILVTVGIITLTDINTLLMALVDFLKQRAAASRIPVETSIE